jgi:hypothetical protein
VVAISSAARPARSKSLLVAVASSNVRQVPDECKLAQLLVDFTTGIRVNAVLTMRFDLITAIVRWLIQSIHGK